MLSNNTVRKLHIVALLLLAMPLVGAFGIQIFMHEMPCPLCLLQRVGMIGIAVGLLLNLRFGIHPLHYGLSIVSALIGAGVSTRQILLHIVPTADGVTGFGDAVLGMHLLHLGFSSVFSFYLRHSYFYDVNEVERKH